MKARKPLKTKDSLHTTFDQETQINNDSTKIYCLTKLNGLQDCQMMLKKNYFSRTIIFPGEKKPRQFATIIKRNSKYIKGIKPYIKVFHPSVDTLKFARCIKHINFLCEQEGIQRKTIRSRDRAVPLHLDRLLKVALRGNYIINSLKSSVPIFDNAWSGYRLRKIKSTQIVTAENITFTVGRSIKDSKAAQDKRMFTMLKDLNKLRNLSEVSLKFSPVGQSKTFFFSIFQNLSEVNSLRSLKVQLGMSLFKEKIPKMKDTMKKFSNLQSLGLVLDFGYSQQTEKLFCNLLPLSGLRSLSVKVISSDFDFEDLATFIYSLANLTSLELCSSFMCFNQYETLFKSIQRLKDLQELSLGEIQNSFQPETKQTTIYGTVFKTIQMLKNLRSVKISLLNCYQDQTEMNQLVSCLLNCPDLDEAKIVLVRNPADESSNVSSDFYDNIAKLLEKIKIFKIKVMDHPSLDVVLKQLSEIMLRRDQWGFYYKCEEYNKKATDHNGKFLY